MKSKFSTGTYVGAPTSTGPGANRVSDAGVEGFVLFDATTTDAHSPVFVVRPGEVVVISAFGLPKGGQTIVEKLRYDVSSMPSGGMCEGGDFAAGAQSQAEDVTQCGLWVLNACQNVSVLALPGTYRLRLNGAAQTSAGTLYVDAMRMKAADAAIIPDDLFFGAVSDCCK